VKLVTPVLSLTTILKKLFEAYLFIGKDAMCSTLNLLNDTHDDLFIYCNMSEYKARNGEIMQESKSTRS
jgi:hypothetical protein